MSNIKRLTEYELEYYAHSLKDKPKKEWQTVKVHLQNVARIAGDFARDFGCYNWGYSAGILHDIGKYSYDFQNMLLTLIDEETSKKRVDHSTAGAKKAIEIYGQQYGKILAYIIAGHHAGLPDGKSTSRSCLEYRLKREIPQYDVDNKDFFKKLNLEEPPFLKSRDKNTKVEQKVFGFKLSFFVRMIYSCLVDADFLDTERFIQPERYYSREKREISDELLENLDEYIKLIKSRAKNTIINRKRDEVLHACKIASEEEPGFFSLTVPTGGGKTLASLYFAIKHAIKYKMKRIIYVIPFTSIIEQNAGIFRNIFGDSYIVEHHSNYDFDDMEGNNWLKLAMENWDAPIIVTTNVQFFETLFANKSSRLRKLHNISNSVVILDEAQTLPVALLYPTIEAIKELKDSYRVTMVFCTATQPALNKRKEFINGIDGVKEIISEPDRLAKVFKRVSLSFIGELEDKEIADKILNYNQVLCIVNTRKHAHDLFELVKKDSEIGVFHLSALMCPKHRSETLKKINNCLQNGNTCRVISTQLIEAGVDIDFPVVFRAIAGLDSIIQAAGRCNREGNLKNGKVFVFKPSARISPGFLRQSTDITEEIQRSNSDLLSLAAIQEFFEQLYWLKGDDLDKNRILDSLSDVRGLNFPFRDIAEKYRIIKTDYVNLVIPYNNEAEQLVESLRFIEKGRIIIRKLQKYIVQIPKYQFLKLLEYGNIEFVQETYPVLIGKSLYNEFTGLWCEDPVFHEVEELII